MRMSYRVIESAQDERGADASLLLHGDYAGDLYSVAGTNEHGEAVHSVLFWTLEEARAEMAKRIGEVAA